ncbi:MAG: hypothetical protein ACRDBH_07190, partial [Bosea sp. (in: a-proteobacteria)]
MSTKPTPKTHQLMLTHGAAALLARTAATPQLITDIGLGSRISQFAEDHLSSLPPAPVQPAQTAAPADWRAWEADYTAWAKTPLPAIEIRERDRDALKE